MDSKKLLQLVHNIRDLKYPADVLLNVDSFQGELVKDLAIDGKEAMAMLGYLLGNGYVKILPDIGLVINPNNQDMQSFAKAGMLKD
ncbi:MAG: hypothetical protein WCI64_12030 [Chlorobium sp.]